MFEYIIGDIVDVKEDYIVLQNGGIGYKIFTSIKSMMDLENDKKEKVIYTQLHVRDDGLFLYGFTTTQEMEIFNLLLKVSKIGPKIAMGALSTLTPNQIKISILNKDVGTLNKCPGIGKKTAERIIVELKDRIDSNVELEDLNEIKDSSDDYEQAVEALISLGYKRYEVQKALNIIDNLDLNIEDMIREGLKKLSKS